MGTRNYKTLILGNPISLKNWDSFTFHMSTATLNTGKKVKWETRKQKRRAFIFKIKSFQKANYNFFLRFCSREDSKEDSLSSSSGKDFLICFNSSFDECSFPLNFLNTWMQHMSLWTSNKRNLGRKKKKGFHKSHQAKPHCHLQEQGSSLRNCAPFLS